jgi:hypothetical protein
MNTIERIFFSEVGMRGDGSFLHGKLSGFGAWHNVYYTHNLGYWIDGWYGRMAKVSREEGRMYMRGLACPTYIIPAQPEQ